MDLSSSPDSVKDISNECDQSHVGIV
ncbi:hypothetical protein NPIL_465491, partial [Nephila pilipes]